MRLEARETRVAASGAAVATALLGYLLWPSGSEGSAVELVPAEQRPPPAAAATAPQPPAMPQPAAVPVAMPDGLVLRGVMASGAVIGFADGGQRYVPIGGDVSPGLKLQAVRLHHAILAAGATSYRLGFAGGATAMTPAGQPGPARTATAFSAGEAQRQAAERAESGRLRQALAPRQVNGQVSGYTLRSASGIPALEQAGLRPGDTIVGVNGSRLTPEQFEELAWTVANADRTEFDVERGGRRIRLTVDGGR